MSLYFSFVFFCSSFFKASAPPEIYTLSLHDALPISRLVYAGDAPRDIHLARHGNADLFLDTLPYGAHRSEEHTSELQSLRHLVCRLLLEKKKTTRSSTPTATCRSETHSRDTQHDTRR